MKLVKEYINEKFTEEGDPISDMGIGLIHKLKEEYVKKHSYSWNKILPENVTIHHLMIFCLTHYDHKTSISEINALIDAGADIKSKDSLYLNYAVNKGIDYVKLLLDRGANPKADRSGAFVDAVYYNKLDIAQLLLDRGADIHANGDLALRQCAKRNKTDLIKWLLKRGANPNARNYYPFQQALKNKNYELVDFFAKAYIKNRKKS